MAKLNAWSDPESGTSLELATTAKRFSPMAANGRSQFRGEDLDRTRDLSWGLLRKMTNSRCMNQTQKRVTK